MFQIAIDKVGEKFYVLISENVHWHLYLIYNLTIEFNLRTYCIKLRKLTRSNEFFFQFICWLKDLNDFVDNPGSVGKEYTALGKTYTISACDNFR